MNEIQNNPKTKNIPTKQVSRFGFVRNVQPKPNAITEQKEIIKSEGFNSQKQVIGSNQNQFIPTRTPKEQHIPPDQIVLRSSLNPSIKTQNANQITNQSSKKESWERFDQDEDALPRSQIPIEALKKIELKNSIRTTFPSIQKVEEQENIISIDEAYKKFPQHSTNERIVLNFKMIGPDLRHSSQKYIPRKFRDTVKTLCLSQNQIDSLRGISFFNQLESLSLAHNKIFSIQELKHIPEHIRKNQIRNLVLRGNPMTEHPDFKHEILRMFPNLESLDQEKITQEEKNLAVSLGPKLSYLYLKILFTIEDHHTSLNRENINLQLKLELYRRAYGTHQAFCRYDIPYDIEARIMKRYKEGKRLIISEDGTTWTYHDQILKNESIQRSSNSSLISNWIGMNLEEYQDRKNNRIRKKVELSNNIEIENSIFEILQLFNDMLNPNYIEMIYNFWSRNITLTEVEIKFGTRVMLLILHLYETQFPKAQDIQQIRILRQELEEQSKNEIYTGFQIFTSNANYLKIMKLLLTKKINMIHEVTRDRQRLLETNFFALSIPGLVGGPNRSNKMIESTEQAHPWSIVNNGQTPIEEQEARNEIKVKRSIESIRKILNNFKTKINDEKLNLNSDLTKLNIKEKKLDKSKINNLNVNINESRISELENKKYRLTSYKELLNSNLLHQNQPNQLKKDKHTIDFDKQSKKLNSKPILTESSINQIKKVLKSHKSKLDQLEISQNPIQINKIENEVKKNEIEQEVNAEEIDENEIAFDGQILKNKLVIKSNNEQNQNSQQNPNEQELQVQDKEIIVSTEIPQKISEAIQTSQELNEQASIIKLDRQLEKLQKSTQNLESTTSKLQENLKSIDPTLDKWNLMISEVKSRKIDHQLDTLANLFYENMLRRKIFLKFKQATRNQRLLRIIFLSWHLWAHRRQNYRKAVRIIRTLKNRIRLAKAFEAWKSVIEKKRSIIDRKLQLQQLINQTQRAQSTQRADRFQDVSINLKSKERPQSAPRRILTNQEKYITNPNSQSQTDSKTPWKPPSLSPSIPKLSTKPIHVLTQDEPKKNKKKKQYHSRSISPSYLCYCKLKPEEFLIESQKTKQNEKKSSKILNSLINTEKCQCGLPNSHGNKQTTPSSKNQIIEYPKQKATSLHNLIENKKNLDNRLLRLELAKSLQENIKNQQFILKSLEETLT